LIGVDQGIGKRNSEEWRDLLFSNRLIKNRGEIGYDSNNIIIVGKTKINRRFHKCKCRLDYFYFFPSLENGLVTTLIMICHAIG
jgi:hypothetical protein